MPPYFLKREPRMLRPPRFTASRAVLLPPRTEQIFRVPMKKITNMMIHPNELLPDDSANRYMTNSFEKG
jgi:hypothetical protein